MNLESAFRAVTLASRKLVLVEESVINKLLIDLASAAIANTAYILEENRKDLARMPESDPKYDRLKLTEQRINDIASDLKNVATLPSPLGRVLDKRNHENGLELTKVSVPLGVVGIIYEARPNVTFDVFSLCLKSGNVCLLKGGSDAHFSNMAIIGILHRVLKGFDVNPNIVQLLPPDRESTAEMMNATDYIDIIIPRGSQGLIDFVRQNARVPVIETGAGIVHTYIDQNADLTKAKAIITNAKLRRVSVCNALDCLIIHSSWLSDLPFLCEDLARGDVEVFADEKSYKVLKESYPANLIFPAQKAHFGTEFLAKKLSIKTVRNIEEALDHIAEYSSKHSEAIISEDQDMINRFSKEVDAAVVYANTSTAFTDGAQFEMGAEIGISTQKLHARGPMALKELTSYKWIVRGQGQIREK